MTTHQVCPTTAQTGVLEFVENTTSLSSYLVDKDGSGAHERYYPNDWTNSQCSKYFYPKTGVKTTDQEKKAILLEIYKNFQPVFRFFILESFRDCSSWMDSRLRYTHSVAVTSIVGHILGIGDRHLQNVLLDKVTAEVVHIDFGYVYEQSKLLKTPETVPFRLTR